MKLIIDFPESEWDYIKNDDDAGLHLLTRAIANGIPLEEELEDIKVEIDTMLKSDEIKNDKWANVIINKSYLFKRIINKHIAELKEKMDRRNIIEEPFSRTDDCLSYEEVFCEARDCGECCCRELKGENNGGI